MNILIMLSSPNLNFTMDFCKEVFILYGWLNSYSHNIKWVSEHDEDT